MQAGIYELPMTEYLADPCPEPSLSTGAVVTLNERSPLHAKHEHPRLGKKPRDDSSRGDFGTAVHALLFGGSKVEFIGEVTKADGEVIVPTDWKTKGAQEARDRIRREGNVPLLTKDAPLLDAIEGSIKGFLAASELKINLADGKPEQTIIWQENGVWHRGRSDHLQTRDAGRVGGGLIIDLDLKTTENADPGTWIRSTMVSQGYDVQLRLRSRGLRIITGLPVLSVCVVAEIEPPFACALVSLSPALEDLADRKINRAQKLWRQCLDSGRWPAYSSGIHYAEPPGWAEWQFEERGEP